MFALHLLANAVCDEKEIHTKVIMSIVVNTEYIGRLNDEKRKHRQNSSEGQEEKASHKHPCNTVK